MSTKKPQESPAGAPAWIVTYSDMVTLLLTFFVMLISMADTRVDKHKFMAGSNSIRRALADLGLSGFLIENKSGPEFKHPKPAYNIDEGMDEEKDRSIDARMEMLRRVLFQIETKMKISPSQIDGISKTFLPMKIQFAPKSAVLNEKAQKELQLAWNQICITTTGHEAMVYILGLAGEENTPSGQMILSARRAKAVKDYLETLNTADKKLPIFCWGAGSGGEWTSRNGLTTQQTQILITLIIEK
ncbi:MAG TPA: flagellar motor protein MotB [Anaerohalosphaeraceae bacterium]|nr:flagellar motor protein MotB [Anaerohalosphaeraceae bacterium]